LADRIVETDQIGRLYPGQPADHEGIEFDEDIYEPFYGGRQFSIRDLNGYTLVFLQPAEK
jgi:hypothetical protein